MAVTSARYGHTLTLLLNQAIDLDALKVMLLNNTATFTRTHTTLDQVAGAESGGERPNEVHGNNWTEGGELLTSTAFTQVVADGDSQSDDSMFDADDVSKTATGGPIGPGYKAVVYDSAHTDKVPLVWIDFGEAQQAGQDTDFKFVWAALGILRFRDYPA